MLYVAWRRILPRKFSRFVLFCPIKKNVLFNLLCVLDQSSQVYQQTRSLEYSESRVTRHGLLWKNKKRTRSRYTSPKRASLVTREIPLPVQDRDSGLPLFRRVFTSVSFFIPLHLWTILFSLILKSYEKSRSKTWNHSRNVNLVSWCLLTWNSVPAYLRNLPTLSQFKSNLKTFLFAQVFS